MKFMGLDGKEYKIGVEHLIKKNQRNVSNLHLETRKLIKETFPPIAVIEEFYIPGCQRLYLDFFIPFLKVAVEVQGLQHVEHNYFFNKTKMDFVNAQKRDKRKIEWCELNKITLIQLFEGETENEWRTKLKSY